MGIGCAYAFVFISQYYTDYKYKPVRVVAEASTTGHGTNIIAGVALGMESTALPVIVISMGITAAYHLGCVGLSAMPGEQERSEFSG